MLEPDPKRVQELFDRLAPDYDRFNRMASLGMDQSWRRRTVSRITEGARVLDVGCGTGDLAILAARRAGDSGSVHGVDFSEAMLELARKKAAHVPGMKFVRGRADALPFSDGSFDFVVSAFVLRSLAAIRDAAVREIMRVLKPGGRACFLELGRPTLPVVRTLHSAYLDFLVPAIGRLTAGKSWPREYLEETVRRFPPPADYRGWFVAAGMAEEARERLCFGLADLIVMRSPSRPKGE